ncbi:hypothetical protein [Thermomonas sp.]|uniref:hypothetical protein n=1 Tax=Thermomonas sp. TaxID=1971895 RepID=UPI002615627E|nr:hypothetical protein [Thermomonas sp.]
MGLTQLIADGRRHRTAFGVFNLVSGLALLAASVLAGALWDWQGPAWTFWSGAACAAGLLLVPVLGRTRATVG